MVLRAKAGNLLLGSLFRLEGFPSTEEVFSSRQPVKARHSMDLCRPRPEIWITRESTQESS